MNKSKIIKVLWVTTSPTGEASRLLNIRDAGSSGGWVLAAYDSLKKKSDIEIVFASASKLIRRGQVLVRSENGISAYCTHLSKISFGVEANNRDVKMWERIINEVKPDLIHVWGTETSVQRDILLANHNIPTVVFIQGLVGIHSHYQDGYFFSKENSSYMSLLARIKSIIPKIKSKYFRRQVVSERMIINASGRIITDNAFTRDYCASINPNVRFYNCPLPVNQAFLDAAWNFEDSEPHRIFTLFGLSGSKGIHQLLKALVIVKKSYPDVRLVIPGPTKLANGFEQNSFLLKYYELWVRRFIHKNNLEQNVIFAGKLTAHRMVEQIRKCRVYVMPSAMEVHAGSLREAMLVGAPSISTYCGSVSEFIKPGVNGLLYRYEDFEILAQRIMTLLKDDGLARQIAQEGRQTMRQIFDEHKDDSIYNIYHKIVMEVRK